MGAHAGHHATQPDGSPSPSRSKKCFISTSRPWEIAPDERRGARRRQDQRQARAVRRRTARIASRAVDAPTRVPPCACPIRTRTSRRSGAFLSEALREAQPRVAPIATMFDLHPRLRRRDGRRGGLAPPVMDYEYRRLRRHRAEYAAHAAALMPRRFRPSARRAQPRPAARVAKGALPEAVRAGAGVPDVSAILAVAADRRRRVARSRCSAPHRDVGAACRALLEPVARPRAAAADAAFSASLAQPWPDSRRGRRSDGLAPTTRVHDRRPRFQRFARAAYRFAPGAVHDRLDRHLGHSDGGRRHRSLDPD